MILLYKKHLLLQLSTASQPVENNCTIEEELKEKPAVSQQLSSDYYRQITRTHKNMDSLKVNLIQVFVIHTRFCLKEMSLALFQTFVA